MCSTEETIQLCSMRLLPWLCTSVKHAKTCIVSAWLSGFRKIRSDQASSRWLDFSLGQSFGLVTMRRIVTNRWLRTARQLSASSWTWASESTLTVHEGWRTSRYTLVMGFTLVMTTWKELHASPARLELHAMITRFKEVVKKFLILTTWKEFYASRTSLEHQERASSC